MESTTTDLVELVRQSAQAGTRRDLDAALSVYAPDAVMDLARTVGMGFIKGATAAAAGASAGAAIIIGEQVITTGASVAIAVITLALLLQRRVKIPEPALVALAAGVGIIAP